MPTFWINFARELFFGQSTLCENTKGSDLPLKKTKTKTFAAVFMLAVRMAMAWCFFVVVSQQCALINSTWSTKLTQYEQAIKEYSLHQCGLMKTTNIQFITECERLSVVMRISPLMAAVTSVINGWNSCLTMPCTQLVHTIANHFEYKLLFMLVSFGFLYYSFKFFTTTRDKTVDFQDMLRAEVTRQYRRENSVKDYEK